MMVGRVREGDSWWVLGEFPFIFPVALAESHGGCGSPEVIQDLSLSVSSAEKSTLTCQSRKPSWDSCAAAGFIPTCFSSAQDLGE